MMQNRISNLGLCTRVHFNYPISSLARYMAAVYSSNYLEATLKSVVEKYISRLVYDILDQANKINAITLTVDSLLTSIIDEYDSEHIYYAIDDDISFYHPVNVDYDPTVYTMVLEELIMKPDWLIYHLFPLVKHARCMGLYCYLVNIYQHNLDNYTISLDYTLNALEKDMT